MPSAVPMGSGTPAWAPIGRPTVRLHAQAPSATSATPPPAASAGRDGRNASTRPRAIWAHPTAANPTISAVLALWAGAMARWMTPAPALSAPRNHQPPLGVVVAVASVLGPSVGRARSAPAKVAPPPPPRRPPPAPEDPLSVTQP